MDTLMIVLRIIHILSGIFWVGTNIFIVFFFEPTIRDAGPAGGTVMGRFTLTKFSLVIALAAFFSVTAGIWMYLIDSQGNLVKWIYSAPGLALTIGGVSGFIAFLLGAIVQGPASMRMAAIQKEILAAGSPATPAQLEEMRLLQNKIRNTSHWGVVLMVIAVIGMATARELGEF